MSVRRKESGHSHILLGCWEVLIGTAIPEDNLGPCIKNLDVYLFISQICVLVVILKKQLEKSSKKNEDKYLL